METFQQNAQISLERVPYSKSVIHVLDTVQSIYTYWIPMEIMVVHIQDDCQLHKQNENGTI